MTQSRLLLQAFDSFDLLAEFDPDTGEIDWLSKSAAGIERPMIHGHVARIGNELWYLYRSSDGVLRVRFHRSEFPITIGVSLDLERSAGRNVLTVIDNGEIVFRKAYKAPALNPRPELDPTPFAEEEDFDFGLFLRNVFENHERRARIYTVNP